VTFVWTACSDADANIKSVTLARCRRRCGGLSIPGPCRWFLIADGAVPTRPLALSATPVADAMAMKTVWSTIVPWPELAE
jgi:hypothetical protein